MFSRSRILIDTENPHQQPWCGQLEVEREVKPDCKLSRSVQLKFEVTFRALQTCCRVCHMPAASASARFLLLFALEIRESPLTVSEDHGRLKNICMSFII